MVTVDPFGDPSRPPRPRRRIFPAFPIAVISLFCVLLVRLALLPGGWAAIERLVSREARVPRYAFNRELACQRLSRAPAGSAEGRCNRWSPRFGTDTTFIVVNRGHLLAMPEYTVATGAVQFRGTRVSGGADPREYPGGMGQLMSFQLTIANTTGRTLDLDGGAPGLSTPHYARGPATVELVLPDSRSPTDETGYAPLLRGNRAPTPEALGPIPPHGRRSGWVTFLVGPQALRTQSLPGARLDFLRVGGQPGDTGQVRL
jgi:hypothetical protein